MAEVILSEQARADLLDIAVYGADRWGAAAAYKFLDSFEAAFTLLERHPDIGRRRDEIGRDARSWLHRGYLLYYRHEADIVAVNRILHGAVEPAAALDPDDQEDFESQ